MLGPGLRDALASPDVYARRDAARRALESGDWRDRMVAVRAISDWQWELSALMTGPLVHDPAASVRRACAAAVGEAVAKTGGWAITKGLSCWHDVLARHENVVALCEALRDRDASVREAAARALGRISEARDCVRTKGGLSGDGFRGAVSKMCEVAVAALAVAYAKDRAPRVRVAALLSLGKLGWREAVAPILRLVGEKPDRALARDAMLSLHLGGATDALASLASDADPFVRATAAWWVWVENPPCKVDESVVPALIADLADPSSRDVAAAALALSRDPRVIEPFVAILRDPATSATLESTAAQALAPYRGEPRVADALIESLRARRRWYTAYVLCGLNDERLIEPFAAFVRGGCGPSEASHIGKALRDIGGSRAEACLRDLGDLIPPEADYDPYD